MIHVIAEIEVLPGQREALLAEFHKIVPIVRDEDGCLEYGPAVDIRAEVVMEGSERNNLVTIIEKWTNVETLRGHLSAPHMVDYRKRAGHLIANVTIRVLKPA